MHGSVRLSCQPDASAAELAYGLGIGKPCSSPAPNAPTLANPLKRKQVLTWARAGFWWGREAVPKPPCRHIGTCRDIGVKDGERCRAFSFWTGASSVSCRGGPRRRSGRRSPHRLPASARRICSRSAASRVTAPSEAAVACAFNSPSGTRRSGPWDRITARSIRFSSSRMLPGQGYWREPSGSPPGSSRSACPCAARTCCAK